MKPGVDAFLEILRSYEASAQAPLTNAKGAFSWSLAEYAMGGMLYFNKQRLGGVGLGKMGISWGFILENGDFMVFHGDWD